MYGDVKDLRAAIFEERNENLELVGVADAALDLEFSALRNCLGVV
jgi:hypothetical protein